jgi:uncharacterized membrane protein YgcG
MTKLKSAAGVLVLCLAVGQAPYSRVAAQASKSTQAKPAPANKLPPDEVDGLMAPVALYPDQLLAQMLLAAGTPARVAELDKWLKTKPPFKGTALQDAAKQQGFEPPLVALVLFPQVVDFMTVNLDWTTEIGQAFAADRNAVLESVQRLRADALKKGTLKSTQQQSISLKTVETGQQIIVIEPANPQVVYVPQYNSQTVYTTAPTSTTTVVVKEESNDNSAAIAAGVIGFTAGIVIGAAMDNDYYYGPYGWHGSPYMYGGGWDDYYDDREDAREDYYEHREDAREDAFEHREEMSENRSDRAQNAQEQRGERSSTTQQQRTERQQTRQQSGATTQSASGTTARTQSAGASTQSAASKPSSSTSSYEAKGQNRDRSSTATERSGTKSDAFSGYSSGKSERSASARGQSSRSGGGGGRSGGGSRSGGGGGGRRR